MKKIIVSVDYYDYIQSKVMAVLPVEEANEKLAEVHAYIDWHKHTCNMEVESRLNYLNCLCYEGSVRVHVEEVESEDTFCEISVEDFLLTFESAS